MRRIRNLTKQVVWHCSATPPSWNGHSADIDRMHRDRGWDGIGYHIVISREGLIAWGEDPKRQGAHAKGHNRETLAIVMVGGVNENGDSENNFTAEQWDSAKATYEFLLRTYPSAEHVGHRDLSEDRDSDGRIQRWEFMKDCPCFSVKEWIDNDLQPVADLYAPWELDSQVPTPEEEKEREFARDHFDSQLEEMFDIEADSTTDPVEDWVNDD